ncbi:hypothetical protein TVAG_197340 [Trichomonas vaginalis G3]|uniref:Ribosomal protein L7Ae/L30e/S12e/Gadd45 domain-containing protein n=1 Tax=Trichomonas vaginalis (strain ATCC PRA-98 / G3) TaxID=412133 RepID=A2EPK4_TRIV3|nr:50S ribosomal protein L30e-like family [Trichomonas vaginalis G3]EAY05433.1 hypothetical protein TVAG_197340 [Trichomonas vaginalis G3]KAI5523875.1 50S ribosomal protein L30e-like family [Trichomonas vaginalis G3]|eukprot:XP_001317656.1 hypothetical protein [Trichomonas vaginalis G3]
MNKVKKQQKQILQTASALKMPEPNNFDENIIINDIKNMAKQHKVIFGINSVLKSSLKLEIKCIIIPKSENFDNAIQPLLSVASRKSIPILSLNTSAKDLAHIFSMKNLSIIATTEPLPDMRFTTILQQGISLQPTIVQIDTFTVNKPK